MKNNISGPAETVETGTINKMCKDKRRYETYEAAKWFGNAMAQRIYHCIYCKGYHLTTKFHTKRKSKKNRIEASK